VREKEREENKRKNWGIEHEYERDKEEKRGGRV
jgi:hypothetical protein